MPIEGGAGAALARERRACTTRTPAASDVTAHGRGKRAPALNEPDRRWEGGKWRRRFCGWAAPVSSDSPAKTVGPYCHPKTGPPRGGPRSTPGGSRVRPHPVLLRTRPARSSTKPRGCSTASRSVPRANHPPNHTISESQGESQGQRFSPLRSSEACHAGGGGIEPRRPAKLKPLMSHRKAAFVFLASRLEKLQTRRKPRIWRSKIRTRRVADRPMM
jgi:hypothetical protein